MIVLRVNVSNESIGRMEYIGDVIRKIELFFHVMCIDRRFIIL